MKKYFLSFLGALLYLFSCSPNEENVNHNMYGPKVVEAHGYVITKDSMSGPKVILVDESKLEKIPVGQPIIVPIKSNIHPAGKFKTVLAGIPIISNPGQDSIPLPTIVPAIDSPYIAGIPEVVIAKDATSADQSHQNLSSFGELQGLKHGQILCMMQDKIGNIWFSTEGNGVSKYDGKSFTHFSEKEGLTSNDIRTMMEDKSGNIWFGTQKSGVIKYDGKSFTRYWEKEGLSNNFVSSILEDQDGNIWIAGNGVSRYNGKTFTYYFMKEGWNHVITCMIQDKIGNIWFGTIGGLSKYDGKTFTNFTTNEGLSTNAIHCILQDKDGNIWIGTQGSGVTKYDGKSFTHITKKDGLISDHVLSIIQDINGDLWFGTVEGVSKYDGNSFTYFDKKEGLVENYVPSMLQDRNGNMWLGSGLHGVSKYIDKSFSHITEENGLSSNYVSSIVQDFNNNIWFGTSNGISKYNGNSFSQLLSKIEVPFNNVTDMLVDNSGNIWISAFQGVFKYDGKYYTHFTEKDGLFNNHVYCMLQDKIGNIWFGSWGSGISKYDGKSFIQFSYGAMMQTYEVITMLQDKTGNIWFGMNGDGLIKYDGTNFTHFTKKGGLLNNNVTSIMEDKSGNLWFGTEGGVSLFDGKNYTHFTEKEGLSNNNVTSMVLDNSDNLWFGTVYGLNKFSKDNVVDVLDKIKKNTLRESDVIFKNYTIEDGFQGRSCNNNSIFESKDNTFWLGSGNRLTVYHSQREEVDSISPNIQITSIALYNESIPWITLEQRKDSTLTLSNGVKLRNFEFDGTTKWYGLPEHLSLAKNNNDLQFNFIGITMNQPHKVKYQYKLEGNDKNWRALTTRTEASYGNLLPGFYTFKVKAMNSEGYWSNEFQYPFTIRPPWWATWWSYSLYILLAGSFVYSLYRYRIIQLEIKQSAQIKTMVATQEDERKRISRDLHDDIGTKLSALKLFLSSLGQKASDTNNEEIKSLAATSEQFIKEAMQDVRQLLLNLSPTVLEEFGYTTAVEGLINKINNTKQIHFNLVVFGMNQRMKNDYELALYRITQELINNVLKHAQAKNVSLQIGQRDEKLILMIEDDGKGFDVLGQKDGYGLNNLHARTKLMRGTIAIDSHMGKGTSVLIEVPYHSNGI